MVTDSELCPLPILDGRQGKHSKGQNNPISSGLWRDNTHSMTAWQDSIDKADYCNNQCNH